MKWVDQPGAPLAFAAVEITSSFSGNAFSVTSARGRLSSPRGQLRLVQNWRMYAMTSSISSELSTPLNDGMMVENPPERPPCTITAFQFKLGSGVVWSQALKSGNVPGRLNTVLVTGAPLPSDPWQVLQPLL